MAVDVLPAFYGDDWFAAAIDNYDAPMRTSANGPCETLELSYPS